jgi:hypothetical protein
MFIIQREKEEVGGETAMNLKVKGFQELQKIKIQTRNVEKYLWRL